MSLKIVGWTDFDSSYPTKNVGGEELYKMVELVREEIYNNGYIFSGEQHQRSLTGVPVFSDGTCFRCSMRFWGYLMSTIYSGSNGEQLSYMDFYMSCEYESNLPEYKEINIAPADITDCSHGYLLKEDVKIMEEAKSFGMFFMTTDLVLQEYFEEMENE